MTFCPSSTSLGSVLQLVSAVGRATASQCRGSALRSFHIPPSHCRRRVLGWITCRTRSFKCSPLHEEEKKLVKGIHLFCHSPVSSAQHHLFKHAIILLNPVIQHKAHPPQPPARKWGFIPCGYFRLLCRSSWARTVPPPPPLFVLCWAEKRLPETEK